MEAQVRTRKEFPAISLFEENFDLSRRPVHGSWLRRADRHWQGRERAATDCDGRVGSGTRGLPLVGFWIGVALGKISLDITHQRYQPDSAQVSWFRAAHQRHRSPHAQGDGGGAGTEAIDRLVAVRYPRRCPGGRGHEARVLIDPKD